MDHVERFSSLSRRLVSQTPLLEEAHEMLAQTRQGCRSYSVAMEYAGSFIGAASFCLFLNGTLPDSVCAGVCGLLVCFVTRYLDNLKANEFFSTIAASFLMALLAYAAGHAGLAPNPDSVTIGGLMLLVPGLLFTNAMRDIIYGDTNSGVNRIVQVFLVAAALALGTGVAWTSACTLWGTPVNTGVMSYNLATQFVTLFIGCVGFTILFNIHDMGVLICPLGAALVWLVYIITENLFDSTIIACFWGAFFASAYSEIMARIRKFPAITYLVISIFPLIPGAGVYYTMNYAMRGDTTRFTSQGIYTAATAAIIAVGILMVSTSVRLHQVWKTRHHK